jgi:predicted nucleic acid-binding protein
MHKAHARAQEFVLSASAASQLIFCRTIEHSVLHPLTTASIASAYGATLMSDSVAVEYWMQLLALPNVLEVPESVGVRALWQQLAARSASSPKILMDAYLAAFAIAGNLSLVTLDRDFAAYKAHGLSLLLLQMD